MTPKANELNCFRCLEFDEGYAPRATFHVMDMGGLRVGSCHQHLATVCRMVATGGEPVLVLPADGKG